MNIANLKIGQLLLWQRPGKKQKILVTVKRLAPDTETVQITEIASERFGVARAQDLYQAVDAPAARVFRPPVMRQRKPRKT